MRSLLFLMLTLVHFNPIHAQELSGKWKGYFIPNNDPEAQLYSYEMDITENENHDLSVITYTNLTGNFSAKAIATGFYSTNTKLVSVNETKFEDINIIGEMQACLMMNFLTYTNIRGRGILQGTYISNNVKGTRDCGGGKVFLEKEELIKIAGKSKNNNTASKLTAPPIKIAVNSINPKLVTPDAKSVKSSTLAVNTATKNSLKTIVNQQTGIKNAVINTTTTKNTATISTTATNAITQKNATPPTQINQSNTLNAIVKTNSIANSSPNTDEETTNAKFQLKEAMPNKLVSESKKEVIETNDPGVNNGEVLPWVLLGRENKLIKRVVTSSKKISLDLYDNGTIDNDTIIIYDNNKVIANLKRLSYKSIHVELDFTSAQHDIIIVAHNMGSIPPNTALVVLNDANTRQEFFITTTNKVNAKFEFVYKPSD